MLERTVKEWIELLPPNGIPAGPIQSVAEVFQDEQVLARDMVVEVGTFLRLATLKLPAFLSSFLKPQAA